MYKRYLMIFTVLFAVICTSLFSMAFEIGGGYRFAPSSFTQHGWNIDLGIFNDFNDILEFDVTYHPQFSFDEKGESSATPTNHWNFDLDAMIPLLGRIDGRDGYRFGIYSTFEYGNFYSGKTTSDATQGTDLDNYNAWENSNYWFAAGIYGQYHLDPWLFELSLGLPIIYNPTNMPFMDRVLGSAEFKARYFVQSGFREFKDHLTVEIQVSTRKIGISVCLIEPF